MSFLKKSLFLVLFLGIVSLSICEEEKKQAEEEEEKQEEQYDQENEEYKEKRGFLDTLKNIGKTVGGIALNVLTG
nr:pictuseptin-2 precursor [Boana picturata]